MAEGLDSDANDKQKNESILLWVRNVEMAIQQGPRVSPDRGLISNPDLTSFVPDPTGVIPSSTDPDPMQAPSLSPPSSHHPTTSIYNPSELLPHLQRNRALASTRSASLSLSSSKRPSVILSHLPSSRSSLRHKARGSLPSGRSEKISSPIHQHLPIASARSKNVENSPGDQDVAARETEVKRNEPCIANVPEETTEHLEEKKECVSTKDDIVSGDEQRLRELRSLVRTRQTSLSPLPAPTTQPSLPPTFNLPNIQAPPTKHQWLKKKLPTVSGIRPGCIVPHTSHTKLLNRATTSPGELNTPIQPKSAPSSPKPNKAVPTSSGESNNEGASSVKDNRKEKENLNRHSGTLERRKSFSHDDVSQLQHLEQLDVGGVSPAASYGLINDESAPGNQQSLVAEGGSNEESEKSIEHSSVGRVESVPSDEAVMRSNSGGLPSSQSVSPVVSDRGGDSDSMNQTSPHHRHPQSTSLLPARQEDHKKVGPSCPLSPPSLSSPCTPHSPFMRQRHLSRSPSPSLPHTPPTSPLHKSWMSGSHVGTESGNVISKQKLKLLNESQTFSFDTSEDSDFTKVSRQPKFLLKKPLQSYPVSPPPALLSPPSPQHSPGTLAHYQQQQHSPSDSADPRTSTKSSSPTQLIGPSFRSRSPVLSEQLLQRRGSTPISLSLMQTQQSGGPFSSKISSRLSSSRSSIHTVNPAKSVIRSPQATRKFTAPKSIEELKETNLKLFEGRNTEMAQARRQSGPADKGSVNRQDSGLGTLSTISNKFHL